MRRWESKWNTGQKEKHNMFYIQNGKSHFVSEVDCLMDWWAHSDVSL